MALTQYTFVATGLMLIHIALCHSTMGEPQPISPGYCSLEGDDCPGPCKLDGAEGGYSNFDSPDNPAAVHWRGKRVGIKYQRNNHGPGGFIRITLVKPEDIMNKAVHERNAFHYSCWGALPREARRDELSRDKFGFSLVGNDGEKHRAKKAYYVAFITIPDVVPDGDYVLGWVWYGGTRGDRIKNNRPVEPKPFGLFADYWACSYIRIKGGDPLARFYDPVFVNDMKQFSSDGCMAANDEPDTCTKEPCEEAAFYRKPAPFKNGKPRRLTRMDFE
ncbi:hypothetical protein FGB62_40g175 [Gracilaria domingensis]|nr:hypothetical protein FGB62_40g175 [Gracilaria domingensis]